MALKQKVLETIVLGGVAFFAEKSAGHLWERFTGKSTPPAGYPPPPETSLGGYRVSADERQVEGVTAAVGRGLLTAFGVPTAQAATAAPAAASFSAQASVSAPDEAPSAPPARKCCGACRAGKPCCGVPDHAHVGGVESDDDDDGDDFFTYALGAAALTNLNAVADVAQRFDAMRKEYEGKLAAAQKAADKGSASAAAEIKQLQKTIDALIKAQAKAASARARLNFSSAPVASKTDKLTDMFERFMLEQSARAQPAAAPAAPQPIIVAAPWGAPSAPAAAPAAAPPAQQPTSDLDFAEDPFANADLMAMLAVSGLDEPAPMGGVSRSSGNASSSSSSGALPPMQNPFPSCGC